jgi:uncharacterized repeat protein (TIGR01451 family)
MTLQNTGTFTATDVTVAVDYADAYGQVAAASAPSPIDAGGVLTWTLPSVAPGATELTFTLALDPVLPAGITAIRAPTAVRSWGNTLASMDPVSQVSAAPQLDGSTLDVSRAWAPPAFPLTYTFTLSNTGNAPSAASWLTVTLPSDLISVTSTSLAYDPPSHRLTWQGAVPVDTPVVLSFSGIVTPTRSTCGQLAVDATLRDELGEATPLASSVDLAVPDADCDGDVDIADIQLVTARWGSAQGDPLYHPRYDLDGDDIIDVADVVAVATRWR